MEKLELTTTTFRLHFEEAKTKMESTKANTINIVDNYVQTRMDEAAAAFTKEVDDVHNCCE